MRCCLESGFTLLDEPTEGGTGADFLTVVTDIAFLQWETGSRHGTRLCSELKILQHCRPVHHLMLGTSLLSPKREVVSVRFRPGS
jgi:hypothetical protein